MSKLKLEVLFGAVDKLTGPMKTIVGGSKTMADALKKTNGELKDLEAQQRKISGFRQLTAQSEKTAQALAKNKQTISELKAALKINPEVQENVTALVRAEAAHKRLMGVQKNQRTELTGMAQEFNKAGIQMDRLNEEESDLKNKIHLTTMELNKQKEALGKHTEAQKKYEKMQERMGKANEMAKKGLMIAGAGAAAMAVPVKIAIDYESAMADVAKVVDGLKDEAGKITPAYTAMSNQILEMTTRLPMAAKDIAAIVAAGAQSGIAKNELIGFAESAVKMGVAFDITADQAGKSMAEMRAAFKMTQDEVVTLADKINYLGNTNTVEATKIMEVVQRIGSLGKVGGLASSSIAAMSASLVSLEPDVAATGIKNVILRLTQGEAATKSMNKAYAELGMDAVTVSKDMQKNADQTISNILKKIGSLEKHKQASIANQLFGTESIAAVTQLVDNIELYEKNLNAVGDASKYAGSMEAEYAARAATTANNIQLAKNSMAAIGITIGNVLLPAVNTVLDKFRNMSSAVYEWTQANPALANTLTKVAVGAIAIVGGLSAISMGLITVVGPIMVVMKSLQAMGLAMSLAASPILIALGLLAVAGYMLYKNWDEIVSGSKLIWQQLSGYVSQKLDLISSYITTKMEAVSGYFSEKWNAIKSLFSGGITGISSLIINWSPIGLFYSAFAKVLSWFGVDLPAKFTGFGAMILEGLKNGILSKVNAVKDAITGAVSGVIDKAKGILGIHSPSRVFMGIGGYTMQGMANGIANANGLPIAATSTATQGVVNTAAQTKPVKPINVGRNNPRSYISQDTIEVHIHVKDGSVVKGTAEAMRQELQRVAEEQQMKKRKFLTDTE